MGKTKIEWCDHTINPIVGCSKCSSGCENCYAEKMAFRLSKNPLTAKKYAGVVDEHGKWTGKVSGLDLAVFDKLPKVPSRVFVGSMCDVFHNSTPASWLFKLSKQFEKYPQHTFILLTKRPENAKWWFDQPVSGRHPNLWLGVTVCNQQEADEKIPALLDIPAALRFISFEPLLGPVSLWRWFPEGSCQKPSNYKGRRFIKNTEYENGIHWVICGAETGPHKGNMNPEWAIALRNQCKDADVPFFFKKDSKGKEFLDGEIVRQFPD